MSGGPELKAGLSQRQLNMITIGGAIGAGLFMGSGTAIQATGPGAFITYALCGGLVILVMRMLGEMATANPSTGSFADYARRAIGGWAGFSVGWLYWYYWVIIVGFEAVAGGELVRYWLPHVPLWLVSLVLMSLMTATNLFSVSSFGEFEYWFAMIKVVTIIAFLGIGVLFILGLWPHAHAGLGNMTSHGGFFPKGVGAIFAVMISVIFSMTGSEVSTIAAAETKDPKRAIAKATSSVISRIAIFFIGSLFVLTAVRSWTDYGPGASPYVLAFKAFSIPGAADVMNAVAVTAVLSCLNSGLYTASRMIFVLAARREAPTVLMRVGNNAVPMNAVIVSSVVGFACVVAAAISPDQVFSILLQSSGAVILFIYVMIAISQIRLRKTTPPEKLLVKMWLHPFLPVVAIVGIVAILVQMLFHTDTRNNLLFSLASWAVVLACYGVLRLRKAPEPTAGSVAEPTGRAQRVLVLANETLSAAELQEEMHRVDKTGSAEYFVCVPANPIDTGQALTKGALYVWDAAAQAAQERLEGMLDAMRADGLAATGELGDYRPLRALATAFAEFHPDQIIISTLPLAESNWLRYDVVERARELYPIPVLHVESHRVADPVAP